MLADAGCDVVLHEQKPRRRSPAHKEDGLAELVCSNSLRSDNPHNAIGLLHEELRRLGSPGAGRRRTSRASPRETPWRSIASRSAAALTVRVTSHPRIHVVGEEVQALPPAPELCIVATGPLTGEALARSLAQAVGAAQLAFYDAIAPIVAGDSVDHAIAFAQSRYGKGGGRGLPEPPAVARGVRALRRRAGARREGRRRTPSKSRATSRAACPSR